MSLKREWPHVLKAIAAVPVLFSVLWLPLMTGGNDPIHLGIAQTLTLSTVCVLALLRKLSIPGPTTRARTFLGVLAVAVLAAAVSTAFSKDLDASVPALLKWIWLGGLGLLTVFLSSERAPASFVFSGLAIAGVIQAAWGFFVWWGGGDLVPTQSGTFYAPNQYAGYLLSIGPLLLASALFAPRRTEAASWAFLAAMVYMAVVLSGSRGGIVAAGIGLASLLVVTGRRQLRQAYARILIFSFLLIVGSLLVISPLILSSSEPNKGILTSVAAKAGSEQNTISARINWGLGSILIGGSRPLTGGGLGTFGDLFLQVQDPAWAWSRYAHNHYAEAFAEGGIGLFAAVAGITFVSLTRQRPNRGGLLAPGRRAGLWAGLIGSSAHLAVDYDWAFSGFAATFITLAALLSASTDAQPDAQSSPRLRSVIALVAGVGALAALGVVVSATLSAPRDSPPTESQLRKAIIAAPYSTYSRKLLAARLAKSEVSFRKEQAIDFLETSAELDELDAQILWDLAKLRSSIGEIKIADNLYQRAIVVAPNAPLSYHLSAEFKLNTLRDPLEAAEVLDSGIQRLSSRPGQERLSSLLAILLLLRSEAEEASWGPARAQQFALRATQLAPTSIDAWMRLGNLECEIGDLQASRAAYDEMERLAEVTQPSVEVPGCVRGN